MRPQRNRRKRIGLPNRTDSRQSEDKRLFHGATVIRFVNDFADDACMAGAGFYKTRFLRQRCVMEDDKRCDTFFVDKLGKEDKTDDDLVFIFVCSEPAISSERAIF